MRYSNFILVVILIFISLSPAAAIENAGTIENAQATSNAYKFENAPATSNAYEIENAQEIANDGEIEKTEAVKSAPDSKNTLIKPKLKIGLVLSGGGSRGFAHIGVLKRLHKHNIIPDIISGCSMGAFIGAMYASGYSPEEIENIVLTSDWDALFSDKPLRSNIIITDREYADNNYLFSFDFRWNKMLWKKAVNDGNFLENMLASKLGIYSAAASNDFNELAIPLRISATDFITGNPEYFDSGNLPELVRASMSYPGLFAPKQYQSKYLIDGFIASNIPIDVLKKEKCDYIIISDVTSDLLPIEKINSILDVIDQTLQISIQPKIYEDLKKANLVISPDVKKISTTDFNNIEAIIKKGEEAITDETISVILSATGDSKKSTLEIKPENYYAISKINHLNLKKLDKSVVKDYTDRLLGKNYDSRNMISTIYNLYGSGHFDKISYNFNKNISDTNLTLNLVLMEKNYNSINLGVYADEYYKAAGCLGFSKNNIDKFGSKLDLETNFGLYKKIRLKYTTQNTTSFKLISQISANYNESFLKLFAGKKFLGKDNYRYKDIVLSVNKYINFHSTFNTAIYFSDYNDELRKPDSYSKAEFLLKYDNLKDYIFPANSSSFIIRFEKFLSQNYKHSDKFFAGISLYPAICDKFILTLNSGAGVSNSKINFYEKFNSGGPDEIPGYRRNEFRTHNIYYFSIGGIYKIREYKSIFKQKLYVSTAAGLAEINETKNFGFDYDKLLFGMNLKFIVSTAFGNLQIAGGYNRQHQNHFYFQYGYKL